MGESWSAAAITGSCGLWRLPDGHILATPWEHTEAVTCPAFMDALLNWGRRIALEVDVL